MSATRGACLKCTWLCSAVTCGVRHVPATKHCEGSEMVRDRHHALAGLVPAIAIACCLALAGCGGSDRTATTQPAQTGAQASAGGPAVSTPAASTAPASTAPAHRPEPR